MRRMWVLPIVGAIAAASLAYGDEVLFKSGDRLTGKIETVDGAKLTMTSKIAGKITVNMADIQTFSTDEPIEIHLADGTVIKQKVVASEPGQIGIGEGGSLKPQNVPVAKIAKVNPAPTKWTGSVTAGAMVARGNTKSDTFSLSADMLRRSEFDRITLGGSYYYANQQDKTTGVSSTTANNWMARAKYDYFICPKWYAYGNATVAQDHITHLDLRFTPGVGAGYQVVETPDLNFNVEGGLSWIYEHYTLPDTTTEQVAVRVAYHLDKQFNNSVKFFHDLEFLPSVEDTSNFLVNAQAGIRAALSQSMFVESKVVLNYNNSPPPGILSTDTRFILSVGWNF